MINISDPQLLFSFLSIDMSTERQAIDTKSLRAMLSRNILQDLATILNLHHQLVTQATLHIKY